MASQEVLSALESLHRELEKLEPAIKHVETAQEVTRIVKDIPQMHIELLSQIRSNDLIHKGVLKDLFEKEVNIITDENKKLQLVTSEIQEQVKVEQKELEKVKETVKGFHERVEKINFPERLDKVDANVSGIMAAIQSVQSRLDGLERNITDRLKDLFDFQKESRIEMKSGLEKIKRDMELEIQSKFQKQQTLIYIIGALVILGLITSIFFKS